ncbi:phage protein Gp27 family protein [Thermodesulfobacterium commune]|uniref:DUF3486 family protein n=1 Tax=Thermodesulfobacterium commune DSM 2178 TaxID=289377 RepID=A0A075WU22_9BACT|nr:phage protein Gp27 family protein [Thermodesulfobacterium commune]AIH04465.1 hypothetical protein HL41_07005 [Thermodesulfobacterium commune DSM 2178]
MRRSKAKLYDLVERIIYLYENEKMTIRDIEALLRSEGYDISKSSIHRTIKSYTELAEEYKRTAEETKALIEALREQPASYQMEAILTMLVSKVFNFVRSIEELEFEDPHELVLALNRLASSVEKMQRYREELEAKMAKVELEAKKRNIDKEFIEYVRKEIFGA